MTMRRWMNLFEGAAVDTLLRQKADFLQSLRLDKRSAATVLDMSPSDPEIAESWFDALMAMYRLIEKNGHADIYRHMMVEDFDVFIESLQDGSGTLGKHWSLNPDIESPTWTKDHRGRVNVYMVGRIDVAQIDFEATLRQNFDWPAESEVIFNGGVYLYYIEDRDEDISINIGRTLPR